MNIYWYSKYI